MKKDTILGWYNAPASKTWICPTCHKKSLVEDWQEEQFYNCERKEHYSDGRKCPCCHEVFDYAWDSELIKSGDNDSEYEFYWHIKKKVKQYCKECISLSYCSQATTVNEQLLLNQLGKGSSLMLVVFQLVKEKFEGKE